MSRSRQNQDVAADTVSASGEVVKESPFDHSPVSFPAGSFDSAALSQAIDQAVITSSEPGVRDDAAISAALTVLNQTPIAEAPTALEPAAIDEEGDGLDGAQSQNPHQLTEDSAGVAMNTSNQFDDQEAADTTAAEQ